MNAIAARTIPQENVHRWRRYWATKSFECARMGLFADIGHTVALIYRQGALLAAFNHSDIPADIDRRLAELARTGDGRPQ